jgi:hypothetical protein
MAEEPPAMDPPGCVNGNLKIENIKVLPGQYEDTYEVTATLNNDSDAVWDFSGARLSVSTSRYPDREVEYFYVHPEVGEIRPGEAVPLAGSFGLYPPGETVARVWFDPAAAQEPYGFTASPRVGDPWVYC